MKMVEEITPKFHPSMKAMKEMEKNVRINFHATLEKSPRFVATRGALRWENWLGLNKNLDLVAH